MLGVCGIVFEEKTPCQAFTAIGKILDGNTYPFDMGDGFIPYRMNVAFLDCIETPIASLLDRLSFIKDKKRWGYPFRTGHFAIPEPDFKLIAAAMKVDGNEG